MQCLVASYAPAVISGGVCDSSAAMALSGTIANPAVQASAEQSVAVLSGPAPENAARSLFAIAVTHTAPEESMTLAQATSHSNNLCRAVRASAVLGDCILASQVVGVARELARLLVMGD